MSSKLQSLLSVCHRFTLEQLKLAPQTHIYLKSVLPGECHEHIYIYGHTPFIYIYLKKRELNMVLLLEKMELRT